MNDFSTPTDLMEISKSKIQLLSSLRSNKMRERNSLFLAEGMKCVADMLPAFNLHMLIVRKGLDVKDGLHSKVEENKIFTASEDVLRKISSLTTPPQVIAAFELPIISDTSHRLNPCELNLLLDGIQDPGNLGTIVRTADWFGFDTIYASNDTVDVFNPKTIQSAMGSMARVKVVYTDIKRLILDSGVKNIYGTLLDGRNMFTDRLKPDGAIIMGNEGKGLSKEIRELVTDPLLIPSYGNREHAESLNVAIATAITLARFRNL